MKNIYDTIRQKESDLRRLEKEVEALRIAATLLTDDTDKPKGQSDDEKLSQPQMIRRVLTDNGEPMHVKEIAKAIKKRFGKSIKVGYITAMIYRYKKRGSLFRKVEGKPNTFALLEWDVSRPAPSTSGETRTVQ